MTNHTPSRFNPASAQLCEPVTLTAETALRWSQYPGVVIKILLVLYASSIEANNGWSAPFSKVKLMEGRASRSGSKRIFEAVEREFDTLKAAGGAYCYRLKSNRWVALNNEAAPLHFTAPRFDTSPNWSGYVYVIRSGDAHKIGKAVNVEQRYWQIEPAPPYPIRLIHTIRTTNHHALESQLHTFFEAKRLNGEWFSLSDEDINLLRHMQDVQF